MKISLDGYMFSVLNNKVQNGEYSSFDDIIEYAIKTTFLEDACIPVFKDEALDFFSKYREPDLSNVKYYKELNDIPIEKVEALNKQIKSMVRDKDQFPPPEFIYANFYKRYWKLNACIQKGLDDVDAGRVQSGEEVFKELLEKYSDDN